MAAAAAAAAGNPRIGWGKVMISDSISGRICPYIGSDTHVPISIYPDIDPYIGPDFEYPISGNTRYQVVPDIGYFPISGHIR